jgi:hypothetical protein
MAEPAINMVGKISEKPLAGVFFLREAAKLFRSGDV